MPLGPKPETLEFNPNPKPSTDSLARPLHPCLLVSDHAKQLRLPTHHAFGPQSGVDRWMLLYLKPESPRP